MILTLFGYPKTGKTLLFNLLTNQKEEISKFSASLNEYHKAIVDVPDQRLQKLAELFATPPVHAKIEFLDTGSMSYGEVKNTTFIDLLRRADGLVHIARAFTDHEIPHPQGSVNPLRDLETMEDELRTIDFITIDKRRERLLADIKKIKSKELVEELELMDRLQAHLEKGLPLRQFNFSIREEILVRGFKFLSQKPLLQLINADESSYPEYKDRVAAPADKRATLVFCGKIETELLELEPEDRDIFKEEYGLGDYSYIRNEFIRTSYSLMELISFFTVGSDETKAWTINVRDTALAAAGKIHTDIQQGFIRAEVIDWQDFLDAGSFSTAKEKGKLRLEGKEYIVKDGEIVHFRFNK